MVKILWQITKITLLLFVHRTIKLGMVTQVGWSTFLGVSHAHISREWDPTTPNFFGITYLLRKGSTYSNEISCDNIYGACF